MNHNYFNNKNVDEDDRRNRAFQVTNAIREGVSLALKKPQPIKYERALDYLHDLSPEIYEEVIELLAYKNESDEVKYFKQKAKALNTEVLPLIEEAITEHKELITKTKDNGQLKIKLGKLFAAKEYFEPRKISEHKILNHDFYLASRPYFEDKIYEDDSYKDYKISDNNYLRLRLLHPDKAEVITGADLIYEQFDLLKNRVRFVHLQYKVWDKKKFNTTDPRLQKQVHKMNTHLCKGNYCLGKHKRNYTKKFRLPYCSGFLRPTDNRTPLSKMITSGYHLPICQALKFIEQKKSMKFDEVVDVSISNNIFEEAFIGNKLGSRWIDIRDLDDFYNKMGLKFYSETIRVHVQEVITTSDKERQTIKPK